MLEKFNLEGVVLKELNGRKNFRSKNLLATKYRHIEDRNNDGLLKFQESDLTFICMPNLFY